MTIEQLLHCDADTLAKMSDAELLKYFEPALKFSHVDKVSKPEPKKSTGLAAATKAQRRENKVNEILKLAGQFNLPNV